MNNKVNSVYNAIGLMSGTSLDGLDIAHCRFELVDHTWAYKIIEADNIIYSDSRVKQLENAPLISSADLMDLDIQYGRWIGEQVKAFIHNNKLKPDFIASHGHTVFHQPSRFITKQIGSGQEIAHATGIKTICNFRSKDVSLGGQGAPLVPIGDRDLFSNYDYCLNIGGIANISFEDSGLRVAYDIGIANILLNYLSQKIGQNFDVDGRIAQSGHIDNKLLNDLNNLQYYSRSRPKSTGYEWFASDILPLINNSSSAIEDLLATATQHISEMIARDINLIYKSNASKLLITGGGAKNKHLIQLLSEKLNNNVFVDIPDDQLIDFKEALIFAFLGVKNIRNEVNCLKSVTGANRDNCGGTVYQ